ncbi:MAG: hypothetical protein PWQ10_530 [Patescibacteria group bacterium]|nr:hypothetical protein [Patescibacteria group bacterium]
MINYTKRLDDAIRQSAWAHEQQNQHRKGTDIPYIIHPFGAMIIASNFTDDEDILIACLLHDTLEDVHSTIYSESDIESEFGEKVLSITKDVTKDKKLCNWHEQSKAYLLHLENKACDEAIIVSAADKMHNLSSILFDYTKCGDDLWQRFYTKSADDQLWWYKSVLDVVVKRNNIVELNEEFTRLVSELSNLLTKNKH